MEEEKEEEKEEQQSLQLTLRESHEYEQLVIAMISMIFSI